MDRHDALEVAQRIVHERFPDAIAAFLTGSALTSRRTPTSDLDIVIVLNGRPAPFRETIHEHHWLVELFVQSPASIKYFSDLEAASQSAATMRMIADGHILVSVDGEAERVQLAALNRLAEGPSPISEEEMSRRRYSLSDQLDDLIGATDPTELLYISQQLVVGASELALLSRSQWLSSGKWLPRDLDISDPDLSRQLLEASKEIIVSGDKRQMENVVREILGRVGGPLLEGYRDAREIPGL